MFSVVNAMYLLAKELKVKFEFDQSVNKITFDNKTATSLTAINSKKEISEYYSDIIIGSADYHFIERNCCLCT